MPATLQSAQMNFHTYDSKDRDTRLIVTVSKTDGQIVALGNQYYGYFADNSQNGPFDLDNIAHVDKNDLLDRVVTIEIQPQGHDTWTFDSALNLHFSDHSELANH